MTDGMHNHPVLHAANAAMTVPVVGLLTGYFPMIVGVLASIAAFILYTIQIFDWFEQRRTRRAAETAKQVIENARVAAEKLLISSQEAASKLATAAQAQTIAAGETAQKLSDVAQTMLDNTEKKA